MTLSLTWHEIWVCSQELKKDAPIRCKIYLCTGCTKMDRRIRGQTVSVFACPFRIEHGKVDHCCGRPLIMNWNVSCVLPSVQVYRKVWDQTLTWHMNGDGSLCLQKMATPHPSFLGSVCSTLYCLNSEKLLMLFILHPKLNWLYVITVDLILKTKSQSQVIESFPVISELSIEAY